MDFELINNYNVDSIVNFLDQNPEVWDKKPDINVPNSPNYKSITSGLFPELGALIYPIIKDLITRIGGNVVQASITLLPAKEDIKQHADEVNNLRRFHISIKTNDQVLFYCGDSKINMKVGECWEFDYKKSHKVLNNGYTDRVHLLIDLTKETN